jgi:peptidoglycan hydrolase CwlO-like protein
MFALFAETSGTEIAGTAVIATVLTAVITSVGTYAASRQAAKVKASERDNDDKWKMIDKLQTELDKVTKEFDDHRKYTDERYATTTRAEAKCQADLARMEERVNFLTNYMEQQGVHIPYKRPPGVGTADLPPLPSTNRKPEGDAK